ncbi:MAG: fatty acid desaturase [Alphaproteobacteria bacterium]|nr:fatty acid desaturase [Alphaproteobacteria bacterium]
METALLAIVLGLAALQFGLLPALVQISPKELVLVILIAALTAPLHYGLMHETMHGHLYGDERVDRPIGRLLGILLGLPWETMRFGHLAHHSLNRHTFDRPEVLNPGEPRAPAAAIYYFKLVLGHGLSYTLMPLPALLPASTTARVLSLMGSGPDVEQLRAAALRTFTNMRRRTALRLDLVAIFALFGLALWFWGESWPVFVGCIAARWSVLSLLDNAPHYGMPLDSGLDARNTSLPVPARWLVMNGNYHGIHHRAPQLSWRELPGAFTQSNAPTQGSWFASIARQFRGPLRLEDV